MGLAIIITFVLALLLSVPIGIALALTALVGLIAIAPDLDVLILLPQKFLAGLGEALLWNLTPSEALR